MVFQPVRAGLLLGRKGLVAAGGGGGGAMTWISKKGDVKGGKSTTVGGEQRLHIIMFNITLLK